MANPKHATSLAEWWSKNWLEFISIIGLVIILGVN